MSPKGEGSLKIQEPVVHFMGIDKSPLSSGGEANPDGNFTSPAFLPHNTETQIKGIKSNISSETTAKQRIMPKE